MKTSTAFWSLAILLALGAGQVSGQRVDDRKFGPTPPAQLTLSRPTPYRVAGKKASEYTAEDWGRVIDSTWGPGQTAAQQLNVFDTFWNLVDQRWSGFPNLALNWDSIRAVYRPQIGSGLSRGRFLALMSRLWLALQEHHTWIVDYKVESIFGTAKALAYKSGVPLLCINTGFLTLLGAAITPMPDGSGLVYRVSADNPLGLVPGDLVLGYEGVPWTRLYQQMLDGGVPVSWNWSSPGSSAESRTHEVISSVGWNWSMFDTIDVVKYSTGDTLHLPTGLLSNYTPTLWATDQVPIAGVPMPQGCYVNGTGPAVSWGVVQGTNIGYVYVWDWDGELGHAGPSAQLFHNAIYDLRHNKNVDGLVLDFRTNWGGYYSSANGGLSQLFNFDPTSNMARASRSSAANHMAFGAFEEVYQSKFTPGNDLFDRPIAVLIGPACLSMGDWNSFRMRFHPMARSFGKPTNGAFVGGRYLMGTIPDQWEYWIPFNAIYSNVPGEGWLVHKGVQPDEEVWLTRDGVARGEDDVVKEAIEWITSLTHAHHIALDRQYARPGADSVCITARLTNPLSHSAALSAIVADSAGVLLDSLRMFDDGAHGDGFAGDSLLGCYVRPTPFSENFYGVAIRTEDLDLRTYRRLPDVARFTTAGPVKFESIVPTRVSADLVRFDKPAVRNRGSSARIPALTGTIMKVDRDTVIDRIYNSRISFGEIPPLSTVTTAQFYGLALKPSAADTVRFELAVEFAAAGFVYWRDTLAFVLGPVTEVAERGDIPMRFELSQNYPNPFNPTTGIRYQVSGASDVRLVVYDFLGREVAVLVNERKAPGSYDVTFDASGLASGVYVYRLTAGREVLSRKMILVR